MGKLTINFEKKKLKNCDMYNHMSYEKDGWYLVTDENDMNQLIIRINGDNYGYVYAIPLDRFVEQHITDMTDVTCSNVEKPLECAVIEKKIPTISENTLLKALAIAQDPKLAKELIIE